MKSLIERILNLDPTAYTEFALLFGPQLLEQMLRKGLPLPDAENLALDFLTSVYSKIKQYNPENGPFEEWVLGQGESYYQAWIRRSCILVRDLEAAASTQSAWMPSTSPTIQGFEAYFVHRPLRIVTGDFCEILADGTGKTLIALGDASGKGASAAVYGTFAGSWLRAFSRSVADPIELLGRLDTVLKEFPAGSQYATVLLIRWCPESSQLQICSGGSPPPILLRRGQVSQIELNGTPVGLPVPSVFTPTDLTVLSGDLLVLYSDGISDQPGPDGIHYGDQRLTEVICQIGQGTLDHIAGSLLADLERYRGDTEQHDDQMLLLIRVI